MAQLYDNEGNPIDVGGSVKIVRQLLSGVPIAKINEIQLYAPQGGGGGGGGDTEETVLTAVGSSGLDVNAGGQYCLTEEQKTTYGVTESLTATKVVQTLLGYDKANILAWSGHTASQIFFKNGMAGYILKNPVTLPADKSNATYNFDINTIEAQMTDTLTEFTASRIKEFKGIINGVHVKFNFSYNRISLDETQAEDVVIPAGSILYATRAFTDMPTHGVVRQPITGSTGLILQIGANEEGATNDEILAYFDLAIKESGCKWFIVMRKNAPGTLDYDTCEQTAVDDLNKTAAKLRKKYGVRFFDHMAYMRSLQALLDQGITPTTSEQYPDKNGVNSNPLTPTQIANNIPCDMECIAKGDTPSSFWQKAYRGDVDGKDSNHFNAQGIECWGKYIYKNLIKLNIVQV